MICMTFLPSGVGRFECWPEYYQVSTAANTLTIKGATMNRVPSACR